MYSPTFTNRTAWIEAIQEAGREDFGEGGNKGTIDPVRAYLSNYLQILELPINVEPTETALHRAYKVLSLTCHPDKEGGRQKVRSIAHLTYIPIYNPFPSSGPLSSSTYLQYEKIREAYDLLLLMVRREEEERKYEWIEFDAEVEKVGWQAGQ